MPPISRHRARRAARTDADAAARLIAVQEKQIAALQAEVAALEAMLTGAAGLTFDYIDMATGEVTKRPLLRREP